MSTTALIIAGIVSIISSYLIADKFHRQGYPFWKTFIMGSLALFGIIVMFMSAAEGKGN